MPRRDHLKENLQRGNDADGRRSASPESLRKNCEALAVPLRLFPKLIGIDSSSAAPYGCLCEGHQLDPMSELNPLLSTFMQRRASLLRYFTARVGEAEAEDLVQETWLRVASQPANDEVRNPAAYLYRLCGNVMLDRLRQERTRAARDAEWRRVNRTVVTSGEEVCEGVPADEVLIARDRLRRLRDALADLPEAVQRTFRMHKLEGLSHSEVAAQLGIEPRAAAAPARCGLRRAG